jgi:hypothetical protein
MAAETTRQIAAGYQGEEMKLTKILGVAAVAALALMAFAGTASATTTLTTNGVVQNGAVTLEGTLTTGTSALLTDTGKSFANTCTSSVVEGKTTTFTGAAVVGNIEKLSFTNCTHNPVVVHKKGTLSVERIGTTTNGTVRSTGAEVTVPVGLFGGTTIVTCTTNNTDIGTLTGSAAGTAEVDVNAVLNCGFFLPSAKWEGTYVLTVPNTTTEAKHHIAVEA